MIWQSIIATVLCAILYRLGGLGADGKLRFPWIPKIAFNTKVRDWGVPVVCLCWVALNLSLVWWQYVAIFLTMWVMLTTYWDGWFDDVDNFYMHGLMIGLCFLFVPSLWLMVLVRSALMAILMGVICANTRNDDVEELSRGAAIAATLPLLLV